MRAMQKRERLERYEQVEGTNPASQLEVDDSMRWRGVGSVQEG
jgi:hypothetical protein